MLKYPHQRTEELFLAQRRMDILKDSDALIEVHRRVILRPKVRPTG